uniref:Uncharacterized protein n=1 Tax=Octopus bimaculoides TaxID=37653 RepID=A0A0L8GCK7_OCTBM
MPGWGDEHGSIAIHVQYHCVNQLAVCITDSSHVRKMMGCLAKFLIENFTKFFHILFGASFS